MKSHIFLLAMTCASGLFASQATTAYDLQLGAYSAAHGSISISSRSEATEIQNNWVAKLDAYASKPILLVQASSSITDSSNNSQQSEKNNILVEVEGDLNQDGKPDLVRLIVDTFRNGATIDENSPEYDGELLDLSISLSGKPQRTIYSKHFGFGDEKNMPRIFITPQGELKLLFNKKSNNRQNQLIQKFTIKMIKGELYIIDFCSEARKASEKSPKEFQKSYCILDLVKGTGERNHKDFKFKAGGVKLATYKGDDEIINKGCND
jgi:hypothetical protein